jgi:hypothetical protein
MIAAGLSVKTNSVRVGPSTWHTYQTLKFSLTEPATLFHSRHEATMPRVPDKTTAQRDLFRHREAGIWSGEVFSFEQMLKGVYLARSPAESLGVGDELVPSAFPAPRNLQRVA